MRLVDITSFFSETCGGIRSYYGEKARFLPGLGVDCHFVVPGKHDEEVTFGGGVLHRLEGPLLPGNGHYRLFGSRAEVAALLRRLRPDIVEVGSHYLLPGWVSETLADMRPRPAVVGFLHSDIPRTLVQPLIRRLPRCLRQAAMKAAWSFVRRRHELYRSTLVASHELAHLLVAERIPRISWVGLGVDVDVFHPTPECPSAAHPNVAYAGRLSGDKGFTTLLASWSEIHAATGAVLTVAGDGPQRKQLLRFIATHPEVSYVGCLRRPSDVAAFFAAADLTVTPGEHETFSLATAEALACGSPVLAPERGGAGELVSRSGGGALFCPGDPLALAGAAVRLLARPIAQRRSLGRLGRSHVVAHFSWPVVAERLLQAYQAALA